MKLTRIHLTPEQCEELVISRPPGTTSVCFGQPRANPEDRHDFNLVLGWIEPQDATRALEAAGIMAAARRERADLRRKQKALKKRTTPRCPTQH